MSNSRRPRPLNKRTRERLAACEVLGLHYWASMSPPEKGRAPAVRPGTPPPSPDTSRQPSDQRSFHASTRHCQIGRYAAGWRAGFRAGAVDALRVAGRRLPVETWHIVEALADQYELAADD